MIYFRRILPYLRPYWRLAFSSLAITLLAVLAGLLEPWPLKILVDNVLGGHPLPPTLSLFLGPLVDKEFHLLLFVVLAGLGVRFAQNGFKVLNSYVDTKLKQSIALDFRSDMFQHAQRLSLAYHDNKRTGMLMYAINNQADNAAGLIMTVPPLLQSSLTLVGMIWITYRIDAQLALLSLTIVPCLYYSVGYYMRRIQPRLQKVMGMEGETMSIIHEAMAMLRVIMAFGREDHEFRRFRAQGERALDARVKLTVRQTFFSLVVNMTIALGTALVLGFGAYQALQGELTVGQLLVVMSYIAAVYGPLETISGTIGSLQQQFVALQIAFQILDTKPEIVDAPNAVQMERCQGAICYENVHFSYQQRSNTLKAVSFQVQPGQVIGIVGTTGAGKSTLVSLLPRFYDPASGRVLLDGRDIRQIQLRSLRQQISLVLQEPLLFSGTIADNIRYGRLEGSEEQIIEAAKAANCHEFIMRLPGKYETQIGERGARLSGGERQRICVARAFLKDAPILILDEPTSSIDSKTEEVILEALKRLMVGRTTFMIAHRLSTVRKADLILVLNQGEVVELGSHDELMARGQRYKQLYQAQIGPANGQTSLAAAVANGQAVGVKA
jgi:ABC-type multidrug transport system fused ATPase/permease subunit